MAAYTILHRPDLHILFPALAARNYPGRSPGLLPSDLLAQAQRHDCAHWLLDARRGDPLDVVKTTWLADEFLPEVATRLAPCPLRLVVFSSPARIEQMRTDAVVVSPVAHALTPKRPYQARGVFTYESAGVWAGC